MKKVIIKNELNFIYDNSRRGAKYSLTGKNWMNRGEYLEAATKFAFGYTPEKDANTAFDKGYDIPELQASVKSNGCSLTSMRLGDTMDEFIEKFFQQSSENTKYIWTSEENDMMYIYIMNNKEFKIFVENFGSWEKSRKTIRIKRSEKRIRKYLEDCL